jgi:hypothetical protein
MMATFPVARVEPMYRYAAACSRSSFLGIYVLLLAGSGAGRAGETLPNGIVLPDIWPPHTSQWTGEPMPVPYLEHPPAVIPITLGRQLFVDDFLIESTDLTRRFHGPEYHPRSPVLKPETDWENDPEDGGVAAPYSDGVWYEPRDKKFRLWFRAAERRTCLAESADGITWTRPSLDVVPGTNVVLTSNNRASQRDSNVVWLDHEAADPAERYKLFEARYARSPYRMALRTSPDGVHWSEETGVSGLAWDRTTAFYNPFRKVWVASVRGHDSQKPQPPHRLRNYFESPTAVGAVSWKNPTDEVSRGLHPPVAGRPGDLQPWVGADRLDPSHPDPAISHEKSQLYNLDAFPYESLMVGLFTIWQGPTNEVCKELNIPKRNEVFVAFSRDGFHWHRPNRERFLPVSEDPKAWNAGNVQSAGGGCLVVGDELRFYCSGRTMNPKPAWSTGLAVMRRDGFASMTAGQGGGTLTTRPVRFSGKHLFVNAAPGRGELRVEVLDETGKSLPGFTSDDFAPVTGDNVRMPVSLRDGRTLESLADRPVRLRFTLSAGSLWSFWITDDPRGASHGYVAAGGPEFAGARDLPK